MNDILNYSMTTVTAGTLRGTEINECYVAVGTDDLSFDEMEDLLDGRYDFHDRVGMSMASWYKIVRDVVKVSNPRPVMTAILTELEKSVNSPLNGYLDHETREDIIGFITNYKNKITEYRVSFN